MRARDLNHKASAGLLPPEGAPQPMANLVERMCSINAQLRPTIGEVCDALEPHAHEDWRKLEMPLGGRLSDGKGHHTVDGLLKEYNDANEAVGIGSTSKEVRTRMCSY